MKNSKKLFCLLLVLVCLTSLGMSGCETATNENEPTTTPTATPTTAATIADSTTTPSATPATVVTAPSTEPTTNPTIKPTTPPTTTPITTPTTPTETVHTHSWKAATCTAPKTCSSCGATEGEANGHIWEEATHSAPKTCTICNAAEGNSLEKPGKENYHGHVYTGGSSSKKYHYEEKCPGKNSHEITWEEVERRNLGPCGTCVLK